MYIYVYRHKHINPPSKRVDDEMRADAKAYTHLNIHIFLYFRTHMYIYVSHTYVYICIYSHSYMYTYICVSVYTHVRIHEYIHPPSKRDDDEMRAEARAVSAPLERNFVLSSSSSNFKLVCMYVY